MKAARKGGSAFATCLLALIDNDEFSDPIDREAVATVIGDAVAVYLQQNAKKR